MVLSAVRSLLSRPAPAPPRPARPEPPGFDHAELSRKIAAERLKHEWQSASELTQGKLASLCGGNGGMLKELADKRPDLKVAELKALRHDPEGLRAVRDLLLERPHLSLGDVTKRDWRGKLLVDPSLVEDRLTLQRREDLKPGELTQMRHDLPSRAHRGAQRELQNRSSLRPTELVAALTANFTP